MNDSGLEGVELYTYSVRIHSEVIK
jgi:hypothetical protein